MHHAGVSGGNAGAGDTASVQLALRRACPSMSQMDAFAVVMLHSMSAHCGATEAGTQRLGPKLLC